NGASGAMHHGYCPYPEFLYFHPLIFTLSAHAFPAFSPLHSLSLFSPPSFCLSFSLSLSYSLSLSIVESSLSLFSLSLSFFLSFFLSFSHFLFRSAERRVGI